MLVVNFIARKVLIQSSFHIRVEGYPQPARSEDRSSLMRRPCFIVEGLRFEVSGLGFKVQGPGSRVHGLRFTVYGLRFKV